jgi:hypothetical protein
MGFMADTKKKINDSLEEARKQAEEQAWLASPLGQATIAKENNQGFLEIEIALGARRGEVHFGSRGRDGLIDGKYKKSSYTGILSDIEDIGWRLEHVGYYFMITEESSRDKLLSTGQRTAVSGQTMGVYLFKNTDKIK